MRLEITANATYKKINETASIITYLKEKSYNFRKLYVCFMSFFEMIFQVL